MSCKLYTVFPYSFILPDSMEQVTEIVSNFIARLLQLRKIGVFGLVHIGTVSSSFDVDRGQCWIICVDQTERMPWIDRAMNVQHICGVWMQCAVFGVRAVDWIAQWVGIELLAINVGALLDEKHQRKTIAEHLRLVIWCLIESEFVARLISPLDCWMRKWKINFSLVIDSWVVNISRHDLLPLAMSDVQEVFCISLIILSYL